MSTGDSWSALLADAVHNPHVPGIEPPTLTTVYFFFVFYMAFMGWVLISIFVAIILECAPRALECPRPLRRLAETVTSLLTSCAAPRRHQVL